MWNRARTGELMNSSPRAVKALGNILDHEIEAETRAGAASTAIFGPGRCRQGSVDVEAFDPLLCPL